MAWALLCAVTTAAGCSGDLSCRSVKPAEGEFALADGVRKVRILSRMGSLEVVGDPEGGRKVRYKGQCLRAAETPEALAVLEQAPSTFQLVNDPAHPDELVLQLPELPAVVDPLRSMLGIEARFAVPPDLEVEIEVAGAAHLAALNMNAPLRLVTGRGDLRLGVCSGAAVLRTGGGTTIVDRHEGDLDVHASAGDMQVWLRKPGRRLTLVTGSGTVQCHLPPDAGFQLDGRTLQGKAGASDFGIQPEVTQEYARAIVGVHGDGRTEIVLRSGIGNLSLRAHTFR